MHKISATIVRLRIIENSHGLSVINPARIVPCGELSLYKDVCASHPSLEYSNQFMQCCIPLRVSALHSDTTLQTLLQKIWCFQSNKIPRRGSGRKWPGMKFLSIIYAERFHTIFFTLFLRLSVCLSVSLFLSLFPSRALLPIAISKRYLISRKSDQQSLVSDFLCIFTPALQI